MQGEIAELEKSMEQLRMQVRDLLPAQKNVSLLLQSLQAASMAHCRALLHVRGIGDHGSPAAMHSLRGRALQLARFNAALGTAASLRAQLENACLTLETKITSTLTVWPTQLQG